MDLSNCSEVNIKLKKPMKISSTFSFHPVFFTNGNIGVNLDLLNMLTNSKLLQDIVLSLGVPISWLEDLRIIVPDVSSDSLALFKSFMEEPKKFHDDSSRQLLTALGLLGTSAASLENSSSEENVISANDDDKFVIECDWVPQYEEIASIQDSDSSASNNNDCATVDHNYSHIVGQFEQTSEEHKVKNLVL